MMNPDYLPAAFTESLRLQEEIIRENVSNAPLIVPNSSVRQTANLPPVFDKACRQKANRNLTFLASNATDHHDGTISHQNLLSSSSASSSVRSTGGILYDHRRFREASIVGYSVDVDRSRKVPILFSRLFMDWVISEDVPREKAMRFVNTLQTELEMFGELECDFPTMPRVWKTMTKLSAETLKKEAPVKKVTDAN
jgi:hypothetical protein